MIGTGGGCATVEKSKSSDRENITAQMHGHAKIVRTLK